MSLLKIEHLSKSYGELEVLKDLSLGVNEGEFVAITGTSGCGKSTLLHIIAGIDDFTDGNVFLDNIEMKKLSKNELAAYRRNKVSLIYQFYNLIPILNVYDNIILPLKLDQKKIDDSYLNSLLETLQLKDHQFHHPSQLSGGQQQRVAIARAMITKPLLILADEPTGNLDKENTLIVMEQLRQLHKENHTTIIMVTHDFELAQTCDRVFLLDNGQLREYDQ